MQSCNVKLKIIFLSILFFGIFGWAEKSVAAPAISSISGTMGHGQTITISGSSFGTKAVAKPQVWDDFESGTVGQLIGTGHPSTLGVIMSAWEVADNDTDVPPGFMPDYSNYVSHGSAGAKSYRHHMTSLGSCSGFDGYGKNITPSTEIYWSVWFYHHFISGSLTGNGPVIKLLRANSGSYYAGNPSVLVTVRTLGNWAGDSGATTLYNNGSSSTPEANDLIDFSESAWQHWEIYWKLSTPGVADGEYTIWENGQVVRSYKNAMTRSTSSGSSLINDFMVPAMVDSQGLSNVSWDYYADDVYVDNTLSRVEICNASTKAASIHCEIQIPSAWSTSSLTTTVNRGSFSVSDSPYLYVVDSTGAVNSNGYQITFSGGSSDTTPPASPTGLTIN